MKPAALALLALLPVPALAYGIAAPIPADSCHGAIAAAERQWRIPERLLDSIGIVESGKREAAGAVGSWPWTINSEGVGQWFRTKAEAVAAVQDLHARGVQSIDVGCLQVNLMYHPDAFASLDQAFDPSANASYAARFLVQLYGQTGTWRQAAAGYHSLTPGVGEEYVRKVMAIWQHEPDANAGAMFAMAGRIAPGVVANAANGWASGGRLISSSPKFTLYGTGGGHVLPLPNTGQMAAGAGRSLASYRAAPTVLAFR